MCNDRKVSTTSLSICLQFLEYDFLDDLVGASWFSKIDHKSGYHHIRMKIGDERKTAYKINMGCISG